jgi:hypothetical protein
MHRASHPSMLSYRELEEHASCSPASPFAGCASADSEAVMEDIVAGRPVANLRCGFMDDASQAWLAGIQNEFAECRYVMHTASFSYGCLPDTSLVVGDQASVCFVAFVDAATVSELGLAANATHYMRWRLVVVEPGMIATTIARAAHALRLMAMRMFPAAELSFYMDLKWAVPANPESLFVQMAGQMHGQSIALATRWHYAALNSTTGKDVFDEFIEVIQHLYQRRYVQRAPAYVKGIRDADFLDIFKQYIYYHGRGYPMHSTGMADAGILIFNHAHPCAAALACVWHNQVSQFSMRLQLSFMYVVQALGLTDAVWMCPQSMNDEPALFPDPNAKVEFVRHDWPRFGQFEHDTDENRNL